VSRIASEAGMTPANMYWHFASKKEILGEILRSDYERVFASLRAAVPDGPADERLVAYVQAYTRMQLEMLGDHTRFGHAALAVSLPLEEQNDLQHRLGRPFQDLLREILQQGADEGTFEFDDVKVTAFAVTTMCEYVYTWYRSGGRLSADEVVGRYAELALAAVGAGPSPGSA
jgi:AcrR family transcriptional regulator